MKAKLITNDVLAFGVLILFAFYPTDPPVSAGEIPHSQVAQVTIHGTTFTVNEKQTPVGIIYLLKASGSRKSAKPGEPLLITNNFEPHLITSNLATDLSNPQIKHASLYAAINDSPRESGVYLAAKVKGTITWGCRKIIAQNPDQQLVFLQTVKWDGSAGPWSLNLEGAGVNIGDTVRQIQGSLETIFLSSIPIDSRRSKSEPWKQTYLLHSSDNQVYVLQFSTNAEFKLSAKDKQGGDVSLHSGSDYKYMIKGYLCPVDSSELDPFLLTRRPAGILHATYCESMQ